MGNDISGVTGEIAANCKRVLLFKKIKTILWNDMFL